MNCQEFRQNLTLYVDDALDAAHRAASDEHLPTCPLCRADLSDVRTIRRRLQTIARPFVSEEMTNQIRGSIATEIFARRAIRQPVLSRSRRRNWFENGLMPYSVGTFASVLLFAIVFMALQHSITTIRNIRLSAVSAAELPRSDAPVLFAAHAKTRRSDSALPFSPAEYAALRSPFALESPSINPKSAFVAVASSLVKGEMSDDAVIVVADVFGNGIAKIADVIEPPRDQRTLDELERVLQSEPAFVPASYDNRPNSVRVVFMIQRVEIHENDTALNKGKKL
jgi:anti-sigma factor RsiW